MGQKISSDARKISSPNATHAGFENENIFDSIFLNLVCELLDVTLAELTRELRGIGIQHDEIETAALNALSRSKTPVPTIRNH